MSIRDWPGHERPREKLLERGAQALSDAELLALLLGSGVRAAPRSTSRAPDRALRLAARAASCRARRAASTSQASARRATPSLQAAVELARRHFREALRTGPALAAPEATRTFLLAQLRDRPYEVFCCLYLDNRHRLIAFEELFRGTIDRAGVHPREVLRQTLSHNAAAVIFAHNHPSGSARAEPGGRADHAAPEGGARAAGRARARSLHRRRRPLLLVLRSGTSLIRGVR